MQLGRPARLLSNQVSPLADVVPQIEQLQPAILIKLDQLKISLADRSSRRTALIAVMRIVPVNSIPLEPAVLRQ